MKQSVVLGIDIGATNSKWGLVNREGLILHQSEISTRGYRDFREFIQSLKNNLYSTVADFDSLYNLKGIGIGAPNANYYTGRIELAPNLEWKGIIEVKRITEQTFGSEVVITNDANAAALGEMLFGNAKGIKDFVMITLGTGLGSGIITDGKLLYGSDGFAGELGHIIIVPNGRLCGCGRRGCLETYVSATGIVKTAEELLASGKYPDSLLKNVSSISAREISRCANEGDALALECFALTGYKLGLVLANVVTVTSPQLFVLFGGLCQAGELLLQPVLRTFNENLMKIYQGKVRILLSALPQSDAAILGAASLIWSKTL